MPVTGHDSKLLWLSQYLIWIKFLFSTGVIMHLGELGELGKQGKRGEDKVIALLDWVQYTLVETGCGVWGVGCGV